MRLPKAVPHSLKEPHTREEAMSEDSVASCLSYFKTAVKEMRGKTLFTKSNTNYKFISYEIYLLHCRTIMHTRSNAPPWYSRSRSYSEIQDFVFSTNHPLHSGYFLGWQISFCLRITSLTWKSQSLLSNIGWLATINRVGKEKAHTERHPSICNYFS